MQSINRYFTNLSQQLGLADELIRLSPKRRAAKQPMQLGEVQDQTEYYNYLGRYKQDAPACALP